MAAPVYATDLTTINDGSGTFTEPAGAVLGTLSNGDTDNFIQSTSCSSKSTGASGAPALAGIGILAGAAQTIASPNAYYAWVFVGGGGLVDTLANGGIRLIIGQDINNYRFWYVDGSDFFPYIGWQCIAIETDNAVVAATGSQGTPNATKQYFGAVFNCKINIGKGNPMALDAIRWGRTITVTLGETANYAVFNGIATENDSINNRWGQFQAIPGGYQLQGKLLLGVTGGSAVDFRDSNKNIVVAISRKTAASFNAIEIQNATSRVDWDSCNFSALGTVSRGTVTVTDDADVNITSCVFTDFSTFVFKANSTIFSTIFRRCDLVTQGSSVITNCKFENSTAAVSLLSNNISNVTNSSFVSDGSNHAIELTTAGTYNLTGNSFTGYATVDGSGGNEVIYNNSGGAITLNGAGNVGTISIRNGSGASTTYSATTNLTIELRDADGALITSNCEVTVVKDSDTSVLHAEDNITDGSTIYSYATAGVLTYITVMNVTGYQPKVVNNYTLPSSNSTLTIQLDTDPYYLNP